VSVVWPSLSTFRGWIRPPAQKPAKRPTVHDSVGGNSRKARMRECGLRIRDPRGGVCIAVERKHTSLREGAGHQRELEDFATASSCRVADLPCATAALVRACASGAPHHRYGYLQFRPSTSSLSKRNTTCEGRPERDGRSGRRHTTWEWPGQLSTGWATRRGRRRTSFRTRATTSWLEPNERCACGRRHAMPRETTRYESSSSSTRPFFPVLHVGGQPGRGWTRGRGAQPR
jgi:hypothetical protein